MSHHLLSWISVQIPSKPLDPTALFAVKNEILITEDLEIIRVSSSLKFSPQSSIGILSKSGQTRTIAAGHPLSGNEQESIFSCLLITMKIITEPNIIFKNKKACIIMSHYL